MFLKRLCEMNGHKKHVDGLNADEWSDDPPQPVDQDIVCEYLDCTDGPVFDPGKRQWNEGDDNQGIEDHGTQNGASR